MRRAIVASAARDRSLLTICRSLTSLATETTISSGVPPEAVPVVFPPARHPAVRWIGWAAIAVWLVALVVQLNVAGVPLDRQGVLAWIAAGLLAFSIGRRPLWTVIVDWLPFAAVLIIYDYARGMSESVGLPVLWQQPVDVDRFLGGGTVPTVWLQEHLKLGHSTWWEAVVSLTYVSFFLVPYLVAGVLWLRSRSAFHQWALRFVTMSFLGVVCFVLLPAAPPWAAAACRPVDVQGGPSNPACMYFSPRYIGSHSLLGAMHTSHPGATPWVERLSGRGWSTLHIPVARQLLDEGQKTVDLVAAMPSLHAGCTLLFVLFIWRRVNRWWRPLLVAYPLLMAFTLIYSAEHYLVDVLAGWVMAVFVHLGFNRLERRRKRARTADTLVTQLPTAMEQQWPPIATTPSSTSPNGGVSSTRPARSTADPAPPGTTAPSASS
jgi:membrane-associated phospholipid phosphatase